MSTRRPPFAARVQEILDHTPSVRELRFELPTGQEFSFQSGQFVMLHVPSANKPLLRAYSVASSDQFTNAFRLIFKYVPQGAASEFVWSLKGSENLTFTGPFGRVFFKEPVADQVVFLCTGTGIAPHLSYLHSRSHLLMNKKCFMFFGVAQEADIFCERELLEIKKTIPHFHYEIVLSRPSLHWTGRRGYVQNFLHETHFDKHKTDFYLCGNGAMIKETRELLERHQIAPEQIHSEAFF
jgi:ferredoxin-NADP reductase